MTGCVTRSAAKRFCSPGIRPVQPLPIPKRSPGVLLVTALTDTRYRIMKYLPIWLLLLGLATQMNPARAENCAAPAEFMAPGKVLPRLTAALSKGGPVHVVAIGSATTVGEDAGGKRGASFPHRMVQALRTALPKATFDLTVLGGSGLTAEAMLPLLKDALEQQSPALVLWQTGTVEAVRGIKPEILRATLNTGIDAIRAAGGDTILIDPQFSRVLRSSTDLEPYLNTLRQAGQGQAGQGASVVLFRRFDLMRAWANEGRIDLEKAAKQDREKIVGDLHLCLGEALSRFALAGTK